MQKTILANFIKFLENNDLVQFDIMGDGADQFSNRFKIQKYVFLAQGLGLKMPYKHDIYLYGPYSKQLTGAYYHLARNRSAYERADGRLDESFDADRFLRVTKDKTNKWLEIAATLIDIKPHCKDRKELLKQVERIKDEPEPGYISKVLCELEDLGLA